MVIMMIRVLKSNKKINFTIISIVLMIIILLQYFPHMADVLFYPVHRQAVRSGFINECGDYEVLSRDGINVYYNGSRYSSAETIVSRVESSIGELSKDLGPVPMGTVNVIIYPEYEKMSIMMSLGPGSPALGAYYCGTIGIYDPDGTSVFRPDRKSLVLHELTHYMLDYMTNGNITAWFTEGMALYEEYRVYGIEWAKDKDYSDYYSIGELENGFYSLDEVKAYRQSFLIVKYICENYGVTGINSIVEDLKIGKSIEQAVKEALGADIDDIMTRSL